MCPECNADHIHHSYCAQLDHEKSCSAGEMKDENRAGVSGRIHLMCEIYPIIVNLFNYDYNVLGRDRSVRWSV